LTGFCGQLCACAPPTRKTASAANDPNSDLRVMALHLIMLLSLAAAAL
jgi:hypothetical protein